MKAKLPLYLILGLLLFAAAPRAAAQQDTNTRTARSPRDTLIERATIFMAEKRYDAAIQTYQDLLKSEPKNAVFLNMAGIAYLNLSNYDQAKKYFERSSKADKKYLSAVNNLGMVWYYQKNYRRAIREYKRAAAIEPAQAGPHANLGFAYYNSTSFPSPRRSFKKRSNWILTSWSAMSASAR